MKKGSHVARGFARYKNT